MAAAKTSFLDKVLDRIGRLDNEGLQTVVQRLARERSFLETLFNTIEDGVLVVDERGRIIYFNEAVTRLVGLKPGAEGEPITRVLTDLDWKTISQFDREGGKHVIRHEFEVSYPRQRCLRLYAAPLDGEAGFAFDPERILKKVRRKTRLLVINSPSNPTGAVVSEKALIELARGLKARAKDAFLLYDDTYARMRFVEGHPRMLARVREILGDQLMIAGTASKTYCMTGWRIGWLLAPRAVINGVSALISHQTQCAASFAQFGAVEALTGPQDFVGELVDEYRMRRDIVVAELNEIPGLSCRVPAGAFYAFPDIRRLLGKSVPDALTFAARLLDEHGVAVVAGEGFGCSGYIRISFARSQDELRRGLAAIRKFVESLAYEPKVMEEALPILRRRAKARR